MRPFHVFDVAIDDALLIRRRDLVLNPFAGQLHGKIGCVLDQLALGKPQLHLDFTTGLLEKTFTLGGRQRRNPRLFGGNFFRASRSQGIDLTDSFAMTPAASVSGLYFAHPQSKYFAIQRIGQDQVEDYAKCKGMSVTEAERWLRPVLAYDPSLVTA